MPTYVIQSPTTVKAHNDRLSYIKSQGFTDVRFINPRHIWDLDRFLDDLPLDSQFIYVNVGMTTQAIIMLRETAAAHALYAEQSISSAMDKYFMTHVMYRKDNKWKLA